MPREVFSEEDHIRIKDQNLPITALQVKGMGLNKFASERFFYLRSY